MILHAATGLFYGADRDDHRAVADDRRHEIGDAVGIAGPNVSATSPARRTSWSRPSVTALLRAEAVRELATSVTSSEKLAGLAVPYVRFAARNRFLIRTPLSEMNHLPEDEREARPEFESTLIAISQALLELTPSDPYVL